MQRRILSLLIAVWLLCGLSLTAFAHDVPDLTREGTIEVTMKKGDTTVPGCTLTAIRVGDILEDDGNYSFGLSEAFAQSGLSLEDVQSAELASDLAQYAKKHSVKGITKEINDDGQVTFGVELGLYLLVQNEAAEGYCEISPFLIGVPNMEDGVYVYEVDASPKVNLIPEEKEPDKPTTDKPSTDKPKDETLPQTGQLNWPVPLLAVSGLGLFLAGWAMRFKGRKDGYEN
ncbi:MAG: hypothetical protein IJX71_01540 [Oscillospiraceae bacterium]|nr:hypothetical protein [Oscillospiraceae bacterium]